MNEVYEDTINYLKYYGEKNHRKIENIAYFLDCELKNYIKLQSNWNSLRKELKQAYRELFEYELVNGKELINNILDKMNELEGEKDNENN